ncbi:MAG: PucR family transcriptional regulator [Chloroflexota bacterium]
MSAPTLALKDLFRLAFSGPVVWLAGDPAARPNINWVVFSVEEAQQGDVLVLSAASDLADSIQRALTQGVSVVLISGDVSLPEESIPAGLSVVSVPGQYNPQVTQRALLTILINQRAALIERGVRIHAQLSQMAAEEHGLAGLVGSLADMTGRGIIVQDKRLAVLAERAPAELKPSWEQAIRQVAMLDSLPEMLRDRKLAASHNTTIEQELGEGLARLVTPITVGGMARGYLSLVGRAGDLDALDSLAAEQGALVCAIEMARNKAVREAEKRLKGDLLNALLQENLSPRDAELWVEGMDLDPAQSHVALRFAWLGSPSPSRRRLETIINGEVSRLGQRIILSPVGTEIICFCEVASGTTRPEKAFALGQAVIDQGAREYASTPLLCGIGTVANNLSEWRVSFRQAGQALELARRFGERKRLYFPDLSVYRLLIQIEHSPELSAFQEEILGTLLSNEGGRDLIRTLESYFQHNGNLSQTAEALYIHRNTLIYRMERIANITGLNMDDPETRLAIQLALHIYRMMGNMRS